MHLQIQYQYIPLQNQEPYPTYLQHPKKALLNNQFKGVQRLQ